RPWGERAAELNPAHLVLFDVMFLGRKACWHRSASFLCQPSSIRQARGQLVVDVERHHARMLSKRVQERCGQWVRTGTCVGSQGAAYGRVGAEQAAGEYVTGTVLHVDGGGRLA
ncbi:hypothetical protein ABZ646_46820, partial [Streptomyces sp. NPDC007162]|uniref:hypothetical protein n=1 Tax=Streptomyces sp. NPDC007162 TaxID=3156917 RepID=UPI0033DC7C98